MLRLGLLRASAAAGTGGLTATGALFGTGGCAAIAGLRFGVLGGSRSAVRLFSAKPAKPAVAAASITAAAAAAASKAPLRPISPHFLQYSFPLAGFSSGFNRATGLAMILGRWSVCVRGCICVTSFCGVAIPACLVLVLQAEV